MRNQHIGPYERWIKRPLDIFCALAAILVFWWLYIMLAVLVRVKLGSPVVFCQERSGKDEKIFKLYKFRSMTNERDENGNYLPDDVRLTKFGRLLRATSLDELPEALNILKGDMSVVGPRPLVPQYLPYYTEEERRRHDVMPGLTGLAQVNGRNSISWEDKFKYDVQYVDHITFWCDVKIIMKTIQKVLVRDGIGQGDKRLISLHEEREAWRNCSEKKRGAEG